VKALNAEKTKKRSQNHPILAGRDFLTKSLIQPQDYWTRYCLNLLWTLRSS